MTIPNPGFWGVNFHLWTWTPNAKGCLKANWPTIISKMKDIGLTTIRCGYDGTTASVFQDFINNYATPAGIAVSVCLLGDYAPGGTEASAYSVGHALGVNVATNLKGLVPWYEIGNEDDSYAIIDGSHVGNWTGDYDNTRFQIARGWWRGLVDGIKSLDTTTPIVNGGITWLHTAFLDMMWNGTQPDGTSGHPTVKWDITAAHWYVNNYAPNDNPENSQGNFNILAHLQTAFGKPIHINEYGANWGAYSSNEANIVTALTGTGSFLMPKWAAVAKTYNITHTCMYQIIDAAANGVSLTDNEMNFGIVDYNNNNKSRYAAIKSFIAANPMSTPVSTGMNFMYDTDAAFSSLPYGFGVDCTAGLQTMMNTAAAAGKGLYLTRQYGIAPNASAASLNVPGGVSGAPFVLEFLAGAEIKNLPHNVNSYTMLQVQNVDYCTIVRPKLHGSRYENGSSDNPPAGPIYGMGIAIYSCGNVQVIEPTIYDCYGDGIEIGWNAHEVWIMNPKIYRAIRNGIGILSCTNLSITDPYIHAMQGAEFDPRAAIDIEPVDGVSGELSNVQIFGGQSHGFPLGLSVDLGAFAGTHVVSIDWFNPTIYNASFSAFRYANSGSGKSGTVKMHRPVYVNSVAPQAISWTGVTVSTSPAAVTIN